MEKEGERERELLLVHLPKWLQLPGLGQAPTESPELQPALPCRCQDPDPWVITSAFPGAQQGAGAEAELKPALHCRMLLSHALA